MFHWLFVEIVTASGFWIAGSNWGKRLTEYQTIAAFLDLLAISLMVRVLGYQTLRRLFRKRATPPCHARHCDSAELRKSIPAADLVEGAGDYVFLNWRQARLEVETIEIDETRIVHSCAACSAIMEVHRHRSWQEIKDCDRNRRALCDACRSWPRCPSARAAAGSGADE